MYGSWSAVFVEKFLHWELWSLEQADAYVAGTFYALDRFAHKAELEKLLAENDFVISDRYTYSSLIHRGTEFLKAGNMAELQHFFAWLLDFEFTHIKLPKPDKIFFLSLTIDNMKALLKKRERSENITADIAEKNLEHQTWSRMVGMEILPKYVENYKIVACEDTNGKLFAREEICQLLLSEIL